MNDGSQKVMDIANHEAGHAVAGHLLGRRFMSLAIWGEIRFEPVPLESKDAITTEIVVTLAGPFAQYHFLSSPSLALMGWHHLGEGGEGSDMAIVRTLLNHLCGADEVEIEKQFRQLRTRTEELLASPSPTWTAVETLSAKLFDVEMLTYEEATQIILTALHN